MNKVTSKDGTTIAYDRKGTGPAVVLVEGALGQRTSGVSAQLAELLAPRFTVYAYDRRGRGDSSNSKPYSVQREVEDLDALITAAGGSAFVFGTSSGACLALEAAIKLGDKTGKLAMYEPPYNSEENSRGAWEAYRKQLGEFIAADRRGDAVALFMQFVGVPAEQVGGMRHMPMWPGLEAVAPTLAYDAACMGEDRVAPLKRAAKVRVPTLVMDGGANLTMMPFMHETAKALAGAIPHAQQVTLEGQRHDVDMQVLAPVLTEFFTRGN